jgi:uncharacterized protein
VPTMLTVLTQTPLFVSGNREAATAEVLPLYRGVSARQDAKAAQNLANHGVSFEAARLAFDDPFAVVREDWRQDYGEVRYVLLGMVQDHLLAVVHAQRGARVRIISARLAEPRERRRYHEENR